ncbi:MAG: Flp pilus assembly protein CpaB [Bryobacteraceae bacterium]|nr:Flp pilus assembly protein CpaB [Bryobacteraceae bacterium]
MDRRFLTVLGVSLVFALVISGLFYQVTSSRAGAAPKPEVQDMRDVVVAAKPLPVGITIKPADVKTVKLPVAHMPKGAFSKVEEVLDRPVISNVLLDEAVLEGRLAARGSGLGLAPVIPVGMRAVTVRVNDVVGVAGFVLPGMRVDVLVTGHPPNQPERLTTTVLQNITVLSAGQTMQPDARGQAINAPTVTLLVNPDQAETITLAQKEGDIQLVLRNATDQDIQTTKGRYVSELFGGARMKTARASAEDEPKPKPRPRPAPVVPVQAFAIAPPPPPPPPEIVVFRGTARSVERVQAGASQN